MRAIKKIDVIYLVSRDLKNNKYFHFLSYVILIKFKMINIFFNVYYCN